MSSEHSLFPATMRSLKRGRSAVPPLAVGSLVLALLAWLAWFTLAEIAVRAVSQTAELAVRSEPHRVQAAVEAPVLEVLVALGQAVERGDLLVRLDPRRVVGELGEQRALAGALERELGQLRLRNAEDRGALESEGDSGRASGQEAEARLVEATEAHALAVADYERVEALNRQGLVSTAELERMRLAVVSGQADLSTAAAARERAASEGRTMVADRRSGLARGSQERDALTGRLLHIRAGIARLESEQTLFDVRAPHAGHVATLAGVGVGSVVLSGDNVATVVPEGELKVVGRFAPVDALGRVRPGQAAWVRLDGFPWTRFGAIRAVVETVAPESSDGAVTVELGIIEAPETIRLQHGLPGRVEVEIETATPAELVLRAAGGAAYAASVNPTKSDT